MGLNKNKEQRLHFFGQGRNTPVYDELRESEAYRVLGHIARLVLIDMLRVYCRASAWDTRLVDGGFAYTLTMCDEPVSKNQFYDAVRRIQEVGFFEDRPDLREKRALAPRQFMPSRRWTKYKPTDAESAKLRRLDAHKTRTRNRDRMRRAKYRDEQSRHPKKKTKSPERGGHQSPERGGYGAEKVASSPRSGEDTRPKR